MPASSSAPTNQQARSAPARCNRLGMASTRPSRPGWPSPRRRTRRRTRRPHARHGGAHGGAGGGAGGEGGGAGPTGHRAAGGPPAARHADRARALPPSRGAARSPPPEPPGRTTSRGRHEQSAVSVVTPVEPARGPADDLVPVSGHPPFRPGVTRVLLRGRPDAGPVRAPVSADADQVRGSPCPRRTQARGGARAARGRARICEPGRPDPPGRFSDGGDAASLGDSSQVTRGSSRSGPDTQVPGPFPRQAPRRVLPERVVNEQLAQRRKISRGGGRQSFHQWIVVPGRQRGTSSPVR